MRPSGSFKSATGDHLAWSIIETTADMGIRIDDTVSWLETIEQAIEGMQTFVLTSKPKIESRVSEPIMITRTNSNEIIDFERDLVRILDEIVYRNDVQEEWIVGADVSMDKEAYTISPHVIDGSKVTRSVEVKAITRHGLYVKKPETSTDTWSAQVILDL